MSSDIEGFTVLFAWVCWGIMQPHIPFTYCCWGIIPAQYHSHAVWILMLLGHMHPSTYTYPVPFPCCSGTDAAGACAFQCWGFLPEGTFPAPGDTVGAAVDVVVPPCHQAGRQGWEGPGLDPLPCLRTDCTAAGRPHWVGSSFAGPPPCLSLAAEESLVELRKQTKIPHKSAYCAVIIIVHDHRLPE